MRAALVLVVLCASCEAYEAPPKIAAMTVTRGLYDPATGPFEVTLSAPVKLASVELTLRTDRRNLEGMTCAAGVDGCAAPSEVVLGPCKVEAAKAERVEGTDRVRYPCQGGAILTDASRTSVRLETVGNLVPYERYTLELAPGLEDDAGRVLHTGDLARFQVKGSYALAPTTFEKGMFFTIIDIDMPVRAQFQFAFWIDVKPETGEVRVFGTDIDPVDPTAIDPKTNRMPADWKTDPRPPTGTTIRASGQVTDSADGRLLIVYPFRLSVAVPRVEAPASEMSGRFDRAMPVGGPMEDRDVVRGALFTPAVTLGEGAEAAAVGEGRGTLTMYRMTSTEQYPLTSLGFTDAELAHPFE